MNVTEIGEMFKKYGDVYVVKSDAKLFWIKFLEFDRTNVGVNTPEADKNSLARIQKTA